jgi:hypothetical protein
MNIHPAVLVIVCILTSAATSALVVRIECAPLNTVRIDDIE